LAVRLMQVAGEYELERKQERNELQSQLQSALSENSDMQRETKALHAQLDVAEKQLAVVNSNLQNVSQNHEDALDDYRREVLRLRFELSHTSGSLKQLKAAVRHGDSSKALTLLSDDYSLENDPAVQSAAEFSVAAAAAALERHGSLDLMDAAVTEGIFSPAALCLAAGQGLSDVVHSILSPAPPANGFGGDALQRSLTQALRAAAKGGSMDIAETLLSLGADPTAASEEDLMGHTTMHCAAIGGCDGLMRQLHDKAGMPLDEPDTLGNAPLALAAAHDKAAAVKYCLLHGADPTRQNEQGLSPADVAKHTKSSSALRVLNDASVLFWNASVRANRLYNEKRFDVAIDCYGRALEVAQAGAVSTSPRDLATLHYNRARAAYRLGRHVSAINDCGSALDCDPAYRNALAQRAECHMSLFEFDKAAKDFQALLDNDPHDRQWERRRRDAVSMRDMSHYVVLNIPREAVGGAVKKGYRRACLKWHPDKHSTSAEDARRANTAFQRIATAYEVLSDSYKRMVYDMEQRSHALGVGLAGQDAHSGDGMGFDKWYAREQEREGERATERAAAVAEADAADAFAQQERQARLRRLQQRQAAAEAARAKPAMPPTQPQLRPSKHAEVPSTSVPVAPPAVPTGRSAGHSPIKPAAAAAAPMPVTHAEAEHSAGAMDAPPPAAPPAPPGISKRPPSAAGAGQGASHHSAAQQQQLPGAHARRSSAAPVAAQVFGSDSGSDFGDSDGEVSSVGTPDVDGGGDYHQRVRDAIGLESMRAAGVDDDELKAMLDEAIADAAAGMAAEGISMGDVGEDWGTPTHSPVMADSDDELQS